MLNRHPPPISEPSNEGVNQKLIDTVENLEKRVSNFRYQLQSEIDELKESLSSLNSKQSGEINKPNIATTEENGDFPPPSNPYHKTESDDQVDSSNQSSLSPTNSFGVDNASPSEISTVEDVEQSSIKLDDNDKTSLKNFNNLKSLKKTE